MSIITFSPTSIPDSVRCLHDLLGPELYAVGGVIRDTVDVLLREGANFAEKTVAQDWDFATPLRPHEVMKRLRNAGVTAVPVGIEHGTVAAVLDGVHYEVTTYRHDIEYLDGRHCEVRFADHIDEDLQRRDFTVNAMAMDLRTLEVYDPFKGILDLRRKLIRTVGDPNERFSEDHLRLVRAARFAAKLEGEIDLQTELAMCEHAPKIQRIANERIRDELLKLLDYRKPSYGIEILRRTHLLKEILPEVDACFDVGQNQYHSHCVGWHTLNSVDAMDQNYPFLRWVLLLHDIGKPVCKQWNEERGDYVFYRHQHVGAGMAEKIMHRLHFSNAEIALATSLISNHMTALHPKMTAATARRLMRRVGPQHIRDFLRMRIADRRGNLKKTRLFEDGFFAFVRHWRRIEREEDALKVADLSVSGRDFIALGLSPGPLFGDLLDALLEMVLDDPSLNRRDLLLKELFLLLEQRGISFKIEAAEQMLQAARS